MKTYKRTDTKPIKIGHLTIGGSKNVVIQSMTNTKTSDIKATIAQIQELQSEGCELVRVAIVDSEDAKAIKEIKKEVTLPLVADIHFDYRLAIEAVTYGIDKIRINPGNIGSKDKVAQVVDICQKHNIPIRIGVNSGSLDKDIESEFKDMSMAMFQSAKKHITILEEFGFTNIIVSMKSSDFVMLEKAVKKFVSTYKYPLHLGVTEAGDYLQAVVKSSAGLIPLLMAGYGDTVRISITGSPIDEIPVANEILKASGVKEGLNIISCPTCGRTQIELEPIIEQVRSQLKDIKKDVTVAIMGCVVNGPGEAKHADVGIAGGKGEAVLFAQGKVIKKLDESEIVESLVKYVKKII